jgi:TPR repeat protein
VQQDNAAALSWYRKAADQGEPPANTISGSGIRTAKVPQDYVAAVSGYRKPADQDYALAQSTLGVVYLNGRGVPPKHEAQHCHTLAGLSMLYFSFFYRVVNSWYACGLHE